MSALITVNKTDTMKEIQTKINNGGTIRFNPGTYKITKQLTIPANTVIDLNGALLQRRGDLQSVFMNKVYKSTTEHNAPGNITIKNGTIEGFGGYSYDNLITFFHSHDIVIEDMRFLDTLCHSIELNSCKNVIIRRCKFHGYNLKNSENAYKECIQIDHAGYSSFVLSGSNRDSVCYDGTCCEDIFIYDCNFNKSNYRDYPYACIGEHAQLNDQNEKHRNIKIYNNEFHCKKNTDLKQPCLSFISMENVEVFNNLFDCYRVARIYSKNFSYNIRGQKVDSSDGEGTCKDISIYHNTMTECHNEKEAFQQYTKSGKIKHSNITYIDNLYKEEVL